MLLLRVALGPRDHALGGFLRHKKRAALIRIHDERIIFGRYVDQWAGRAHSRIIDQDIDRARFGFGMRDRRFDACIIGHVERDDMRGTAVGLDFRTQFLQPLDPPRRQYHLCTGLRQDFCKTGAESARCACHQCDFSFEIEFYAHGISPYCLALDVFTTTKPLSLHESAQHGVHAMTVHSPAYIDWGVSDRHRFNNPALAFPGKIPDN